MANTTWNPSDKTANITLSGGNLIATFSNNFIGGARAAHSQTTGKYYFEVTANQMNYGGGGIGMANATIDMTSVVPSTVATGTTGLRTSNGSIYVNGVAGPALAPITAGMVICVAVDLGARLIWYRQGAAGQWNGSGAANPGTGVGGVTLTSLGGGSLAAFPWFSSGNNGDKATANFGDSAFVGAVPSGFTAGFPTVPPATSARTQTAVSINTG